MPSAKRTLPPSGHESGEHTTVRSDAATEAVLFDYACATCRRQSRSHEEGTTARALVPNAVNGCNAQLASERHGPPQRAANA
eukprot:5195970-Prymnesium_polylepis.1